VICDPNQQLNYSMVTRVNCTSPNQFSQLLKEAENGGNPFFILFTGSKGSNGKSWCPDCTAADPVIDSALNGLAGGCKILVCDVNREEYRDQNYVYRKDPRINLRCVPTLIKWRSGKILARLNDSQSQQAGLVQDLIES
jgi:hypothetical protein